MGKLPGISNVSDLKCLRCGWEWFAKNRITAAYVDPHHTALHWHKVWSGYLWNWFFHCCNCLYQRAIIRGHDCKKFVDQRTMDDVSPFIMLNTCPSCLQAIQVKVTALFLSSSFWRSFKAYQATGKLDAGLCRFHNYSIQHALQPFYNWPQSVICFKKTRVFHWLIPSSWSSYQL